MKLLFERLKPTSYYLFTCLAIGLLLPSCASYRQNIMFTANDAQALKPEVQTAEKNYIIQTNDYLQVDIYTNNGERIIDPDLKLAENNNLQTPNAHPEIKYLVDINGAIKLPLIGELTVEGLTVREAEAIVQKEYTRFYADPYAAVTCINKRVIVLGTPIGVVVPLENENVRLAEILAISKAVDNTAKANNIRVIRNEKVFQVDFTTIAGYQQGNMIMEPGDIVYVEPVRKPVREAFRDYGPIISVITSLVTIIVVLNR